MTNHPSLKKAKLRSKKAKIAFLKRSAAAKQIHYERRKHRHFKFHVRLIVVLLILGFGAWGLVASRSRELTVPPPSNAARLDVYIRAAQAHQSALPVGEKPADQIGVGSWYALGLREPDALTCASTHFPRGTYLRVKDLRNNKEVTCLVNDYGPTPGTKRVVDLSRGSYKSLEGLGSGTIPVEIRVATGP